jgi:beta-lactamase class A
VDRALFLTGGAAAIAAAATPREKSAFVAVERQTGGRLGVFAVDTASETVLAHRAGERFPMCSTFKFLLVAAVLARVDARRERLDRKVAFVKRDLLEYAPVTTAHAGAGFMTVGALCAAAIEVSDNTAANLLIELLGGPQAVTRYARTLGDSFTRLDRSEPSLNSAIPGDARDTTTPAAMARDARAVLTGSALLPASRKRLTSWTIGCLTGTTCIRAGIPSSWRAGDKTGSGRNGTRNDVAILWPPGRAPIIVAAYLTGATVPSQARAAALARVGHITSRAFS